MIDKCYDASGFLVQTIRQNQINRESWDTFRRIQILNSNVSTIRSAGRSNIYYYNFKNNTEKNYFLQGQFLHFQVYPSLSSFWQAVEKN
jgi:hypothetical protein